MAGLAISGKNLAEGTTEIEQRGGKPSSTWATKLGLVIGIPRRHLASCDWILLRVTILVSEKGMLSHAYRIVGRATFSHRQEARNETSGPR